jgi:hypothetical protein
MAYRSRSATLCGRLDSGDLHERISPLSALELLRAVTATRQEGANVEERLLPNLPPLQQAGVERMVETVTAAERGDKLAFVRFDPELAEYDGVITF